MDGRTTIKCHSKKDKVYKALQMAGCNNAPESSYNTNKLQKRSEILVSKSKCYLLHIKIKQVKYISYNSVKDFNAVPFSKCHSA